MTETTHEYRVFIQESHLDTFGHVNNATYLQLFEEARWDLITARGYGLEKIRESRLGPVILEANVKFRREVTNRETVTIVTTLESYEGKIGKLRQRMKKEDGALACDALFVCALWDIDARKMVPPTPEWAHAVLLPLEPSSSEPG
ncbi:MAG TPA: acyl-CoA thioesterase [Polyangiaceae bacterium]|nr:acyl-CoA thioesterase [Polyangiaceae bacterium]